MADDDSGIVITKPGVLAFGEGLPNGSSIESFFRDETIVQVSCGKNHSAVVCESGLVYTFGKNQCNGWMKNDAEYIAEPTLVDNLSSVNIIQAACGYRYTMFLSDKGELYSCGLNDYGQLGLGHTSNTLTPVLVAGLPPIKKVSAAWRHTVGLTDSGEVWVCGQNCYGQLGLGHTNLQASFTCVPNLPEAIVDISCGGYHIALVSASRVLLMAGLNRYGQLGLGTVESVSSFTQVSAQSSAVAAVSCGNYHTVALRVDGTTWAWGNNTDGRLGTGDTAKRSAPTRMIGLEDQTVSQVIAGCRNTALLTLQGDVFVCGQGTSGELGLRKKNFSVATQLAKSPGLLVQQVALAETYSILLVVPRSSITLKPQLGISIAERGDRVRECTTDLERNMIECLSANTQLPCTECLLRMPSCELGGHGAVCPCRDYDCPLACGGWRGQTEAMLAHALSAHADRTWPDLPRTFVQRRGLLLTDVLAAHGRVFTLHRGYDGEGRTFRAAVRYIGTPDDRYAFTFKFTLLIEGMQVTYRRNLCSDIERVEDMFRSSNSINVGKELLDIFLQKGDLTCRVAILKTESQVSLTK